MRVFLKNSMNISMLPVKSLRSSLIRRLCGLILLQPVLRKKNGGQETEALGRSRGGFTTKLHAAVSAEFWFPLRFTLTAGQRHDITQGPALIAGYTSNAVIADAAYDSDAFGAEIAARDAVVVIRPRKSRVEDRPYDKGLYKLRNVIERFFHRLKQYRRVATCYDKYAVRYLGFASVAAIHITTKKM